MPLFWRRRRSGDETYRREVARENRRFQRQLKKRRSIDEILAEADAEEAKIRDIVSKRPDIVSVLTEHQKSLEDIRDIRSEMILASTSIYVADQVLQDAALLSQFFSMKKSGLSMEKIAFNLIQAVRGR